MATVINININGQGVSQSVKQSKPVESDPYRDFPLLPGFTRVRELDGFRKLKPKKKKNCSNGQVCGFSCISKSKTCIANMTTAQLKEHNAAKRAKKKAAKAGASGGASQSQLSFPDENNGIKHRPFMTETEANEYVKGSVWADQIFFHGTSDGGADSITSEGVKIDANLVAAHGRGFYMGGGEDGMLIAESFASGQVLSMKVLARNPLVTDGQGHSEIVAKGIAEGKISPKYLDNQQGGIDKSQNHAAEVTEYIKSLGYDAIQIVGKDHFIVFDPKQVAVFKRENTDIDLDDLISSFN